MSILDELYDLVLSGKRSEVGDVVQKAVDAGIKPKAIIEETLRPAINEVGESFSRAEFYLPDLILAADAMKRATEYLRPLLAAEGSAARQETVVIGTASGDLHDIGKNLVISLLEGSGYNVVDLGVDVPSDKVVAAVREHNPVMVGFSALLTTTMVNIPVAVRALEEASLREGRILAVGGAPVTQRNADEWGVELYAPDAGTAVRMLNEMLAAR